MPGRLDAVDGDPGIVQERMEQTDGVGAAADASHQGIRQTAAIGQHLLARLAADHRLEFPDHQRIGVRAGDGADHVKGVIDVGHPVAQRFVERVLEGAGAGIDRLDGRAQQLHAVDIQRLALDVFRPHVNHAFHAEPGGDGCGRHAVLAGPGFGDEPGLTHPRGQQALADGVVDLVRAGVVEVFALEMDLRAAQLPAPAFGVIERAGAADVTRQVSVQFRQKFWIVAVVLPRFVQLVQRSHERFGDEATAIATEMAGGIGELAVVHLIAQGFHTHTHLAGTHASIRHP